MHVDHIFIFSKGKGAEADELIDFGLAEGSSRVHLGQGTTNRKFYFENFFLEILWVHDQQEVQSEPAKTTELWERSNFETNGYNPFGLCLINTNNTNEIFIDSMLYQPAYFPKGMAVDFISSAKLPWLFRLPFKNQKKSTTEPLDHSIKLTRLTEVTFEIPEKTALTNSIEELSKGSISFEISDRPNLHLEFDNCRSNQEKIFQELPLTIRY